VQKVKKFKETVVKALLPHIILTEAARRSIYGYDIIKQIRKTYGVYLGPSTTYPALNDLEKIGLLQSQWTQPTPQSQRPRKFYTLTSKGKIQLAQGSTVLALVNRMIEVKAS